MEVATIIFVEFNEDTADNVALIGDIISNKQDGTFCENISWDRSRYTQEQNKLIETLAFKSEVYDKMFDAYEDEKQERLIENFL